MRTLKTMDDETRARIEKDCKNALQCLYIAVEESVAQDVDNKVSAYVHLLKTEHSRITELLKSLDTALDELQTKEVEYKECAVPENINYEYFKGKRDAYEFSVKTIKRVLQWHEALKGKQQ